MGKIDIPPQQWPVLSRLLDEALELPPDERDRWFSALPAEYDNVKPLLGRLLARASSVLSGNLLADLPAFEEQENSAACTEEIAAGEALGPWRLIRPVGEGGMASVWLAEHADGSQAPPVALKLPRPGNHAAALAERMAREREILATLHHPNIARLLDAGILPNGSPYLALEYVDGLHIDDYCRERRLSLEKRLELFTQIAHAIAHAHNQLIVHRDLKPSNILVTEDGQVHLLDFGIAKILHHGETRETRLTRFSGTAFTLDYASPEQVAGRPLTVASDVYSLGVVLYEMLAGVRPYRLRRDSQAALEEAILEVEPRPPSELAIGRPLARALRGDLNTIVLKALKKDPAARYSSMDAFADDIRRYTLHLPVAAQPDRFHYRFSKFIRRHWLAVSSTATTIALVLTGAALVARQAHIAFVERGKSEEIKSFLVSSLLDSHSYWSGRPLSALELLHHVQSRLDHLKSANPETRVELLNIISASMLSLQDTAGAESATSAAIRQAAGLPRGQPQLLRARLLENWIRLYRGRFLEARGDIEDVISAMRASPAVFPEDFAGALRIRAEVALEDGDSPRAETSAQEALDIAEARLGARHNQSVLALVDLSSAYLAAGKSKLALETCERARTRALDTYSGQWTHPNTIKARVACSQALAASGQYATAIDEAHRAFADSVELFGASSRIVGIQLASLARLELDNGDLASAYQDAGHAISVLRHQFDLQSPGYAGLLKLRGLILLHQRRYAAAMRDLVPAGEIARRSLGPTHPEAIAIGSYRAAALARAGNLREAQQALTPVRPDANPSVDHWLGVVLRLKGSPDQALQLQRRALGVRTKNPGEFLRAEIAVEIGLDLLALSQPQIAATALEPVLAWCNRFPNPPPCCAEGRAALRLCRRNGAPADSPSDAPARKSGASD